MSKKFDPYQPDAASCVGRGIFLNHLLAVALDRRCVLLFGGRQSGKTTMLLKLAANMAQSVSVSRMDTFTCPVYVNLTALPMNASPADFFEVLSDAASAACARSIDGFVVSDAATNQCSTIEGFAARIQEITSGAGEVDLTILFLLDEAERVLGERFPRGFQDNLFAVLYGADLSQKTKMGIVFAGAQSLYKFSEDDTSPIGSRAAYLYVNGIESSISEFFAIIHDLYGIDILPEIQKRVLTLTGGHAGLTARISSFISVNKIESLEEFEEALPSFKMECKQLFRLWATSLSPQARAIHDRLGYSSAFTRQQVFLIFKDKNWDPIFAEKAIDELMFTGIVKYSNGNITIINDIYWEYVLEFLPPPASECECIESSVVVDPGGYDEIWSLIEKAEIALRSHISSIYTEKFGSLAESKIRAALGKVSMEKVVSNVSKSNRRYRHSERETVLGIFDGLYLGQLPQLMTTKDAWNFFSNLAADKRELELMIAPITAVRTDKAHFYSVPHREILRCKLHCEDLISVIEKNLLKGAV